jgi:uncharacterized membrane protein YuzA (DUF378 family)
MEFLLLAKINAAFQIAEKIAYGIIGLVAAKIVVKSIKDYKDSVEEDRYSK